MSIAAIDLIDVDEKGVARIAGTRMKVSHLIVDHYCHAWTPKDFIRQYPHLTLAQVHAAFAYYYLHQAEVDAQIKSADEYAVQISKSASNQPSRTELLKRLESRP